MNRLRMFHTNRFGSCLCLNSTIMSLSRMRLNWFSSHIFPLFSFLLLSTFNITSLYIRRSYINSLSTFSFTLITFSPMWWSIWHICFLSKIGAGSGNRTRIASLEDWHSTVELYPQKWRLGKDLNLRGLLHPGALAKLCIRPLCHLSVGGRRGIRTPGGFDTPSVFKTDALDRSATLP